MDTINSRIKIGFPAQRDDWTKTVAVYDEHTLQIAGHPVMEDWEAGYMKTLASIASSRGGNVLEVGFGLGLSAKAIQASRIERHFIIECHPDVIRKCLEDFRDAIIGSSGNRLHILSGFWQDVTPLLADEQFDGILFDTYPLSEKEIHSNHFAFFSEAYRLLKRGGIFTYYSDEAKEFSKRHLEKLETAGFQKENIGFRLCEINPPAECRYWNEKTMIAPVITK